MDKKRKWLKYIGIGCLIPAMLLLLVSALVYIPAIQAFTVRKASSQISQSLGIDFHFEKLRIKFPLDLSIHNALAISNGKDTILQLEKLTLRVKPKPLLKGDISINEAQIKSVNIYSGNLVENAYISGFAQNIFIKADSISPTNKYAIVNIFQISDADIIFSLCDSTAKDTAQSDAKWMIDIEKAEFKNMAFSYRMPCDSINASLNVLEAVLDNGFVDLSNNQYGFKHFSLNAHKIDYDTNPNPPSNSLDVSHIHLNDITLTLDSVFYAGEKNMRARISGFTANERSGLTLHSLTGQFVSDSFRISIPNLKLQTPYSDVHINAHVPWTSLDKKTPSGKMSVEISSSIAKKDMMAFIKGDNMANLDNLYPDTTFTLKAYADGNTKQLNIKYLESNLNGAFRLDVYGSIQNLTDERIRTGKINLDAQTENMAFATALFPPSYRARINLPDSMKLIGELTLDKGNYLMDMSLTEGRGNVFLNGGYHTLRNSYHFDLKIDSLDATRFLPHDSIKNITISIRGNGQGTDIYKASTTVQIEGAIKNIQYGNYSISDIRMNGTLKNNHLQSELISDVPFMRGKITINGDILKNHIVAQIISEVDSIDLYRMNLAKEPLSTSFRISSQAVSDLRKNHSANILLNDWEMHFNNRIVRPKDMAFEFRTDNDTTHAVFSAGDLGITLTGNADLQTLAERTRLLAEEVQLQLKRDSTIDFQSLRHEFPDVCLAIKAGKENPFYNILQFNNIFFEHLFVDFDMSPEKGLVAKGQLLSFVRDTFKIDTIALDIHQDTLGMVYRVNVIKNRFRRQDAFRGGINGYVRKDSADIFMSYLNAKGENGISLGGKLQKIPEGFDLQLYPKNPTIMFLPFTVSDNNFLRFKNMKEMAADLRLEGAEHSSLWIHSDNKEIDMNEMMVEINNINLKKVSSGFAELPDLDGIFNTTLRYVPDKASFLIVGDANVNELFYNKGRVGELLLNATYIPVEKNTHQLDIHAFRDQKEITSLYLLYKNGRNENKLEGEVLMERFPLEMLNPMIPRQIFRLKGALLSNITISGTDKNPWINGTLKLDSTTMYLAPYSTTLRFDNKEVKINRNKLLFKKFHIHASGNNPLSINGSVDATNIGNPKADLTLTATNLQLMDAKKTRESLAYGKLFVNLNTTLIGTPQSLKMRGNMRLLGNTNMTYVMLNTPLEIEDSFSDLVTFTYFTDTLPRRTRNMLQLLNERRNIPIAGGMDIQLMLRIDPLVKIKVDLNEEQTNHVEVTGGGDLTFRYTPQGDMTLNGRYSISNGSIRYNIPVIPITNFSIRNGSYIDWRGDLMNPYLNINAYTKARSAVSFDGQSRMVDFNPGLSVKNNLNNMSVKFLLEAPNDASVQNQLATMGEEERSKQAISLLVAGIYLASNKMGSDNVDVEAAISSFLQRKINNMLGNMLGEVPVSFDVNTYDGTNGMGRRIDYVGRFYKGFMNDKLYTTLGIRYSTKDPIYKDQWLLDDLSIEYRLDDEAARSLKWFYGKNYQSVFEGEIGRMGVSYIIRRKVKRLADMFFFPIPKQSIANSRDDEKVQEDGHNIEEQTSTIEKETKTNEN